MRHVLDSAYDRSFMTLPRNHPVYVRFNPAEPLQRRCRRMLGVPAVSPPGLRPRNASRCVPRADMVGLAPKPVSSIIIGNDPVTSDSALRLELVFGHEASIWTSL